MNYIKNSSPYTSYCDPVSRQAIKPGEIVAVKKMTSAMQRRIRAGGLVVCSEEEYNDKNDVQKPVAVEKLSTPEEVKEEVEKEEPKEEPSVLQLPKKKKKSTRKRLITD